MRLPRQKVIKKEWKITTDAIQTEVDDNTADVLLHGGRLDTLET